MARNNSTTGVVVIGLGRFGKSLALELERDGIEVLGIDSSPKMVQSLASRLTHVVEADSTDAGRHAPALRARVRPCRHRYRHRPRGQHPDRLRAAQFRGPEHLGQGDQQVPRPHPHPARRAPRRPPRARHGPAGRAPGPRPDARLHRVRRRIRHRQDPAARRASSASPSASHGSDPSTASPSSVSSGPARDFTHATPETVVEPGDLIIVSGDQRGVERFSEQR